MSRNQWVTAAIVVATLIGLFITLDSPKKPTRTVPASPSISQTPQAREMPTAAESLLVGFGDPATPPVEDLRKLQRVAIGYYSLIKDSQRFPIGGNEDFAAALRGENPNREVFVRPGNPLFSPEGLLIDRWGSPLIIHPLAWRQLELRSAGPDRIPHNADDLVLSPTGISSP